MTQSARRTRRVLALAATGALGVSMLTLATAPSAQAAAGTTAYALSGTNLLAFDPAKPTTVATKALTGINAGETLVGIDVRPQNGMLYGLGVNPGADTGTLYAMAPETGYVTPVGTLGAMTLTTDGVTKVDLPDPAAVGYGMDFNPAVDRIRVVVGGLNFRINPNTGLPVDGDNTGTTSGSVSGTNPDGPVNGGTANIDAAAYTNNRANNGTISTLYTLDSLSNSLFIQNPPNTGTQTNAKVVKLGASTLNFTAASGFDIDDSVNAASSNAAVASGSAYAVLSVSGATKLYRINLVTGAATVVGSIGNGSVPVQGLALQQNASTAGRPVVGLTSNGQSLARFASTKPGEVTTQAITGIASGDVLVGVSWRPATGQLYGVAVDAVDDNATLYLIDPQTGTSTAIGTPGQIAFTTDGSTPVDFADPATTGYGVDFNATVDRIRVVNGNGLNFRFNPSNAMPTDGNNGGATVTGTNPDGSVNGLALGSTGLTATAYTNSYGQSLTGGVTTVYGIDPTANELTLINPPNSGTATNRKALMLSGSPLDVAGLVGFDIKREIKVATSGVAATGSAYASFVVGGVPGLYLVDLASGKVTSVGPLKAVGTGTAVSLRSIAVGSAQTPPPLKAPATLVKVATQKQVKAKADTGRVLKCPANFATSTCTVTTKIFVTSGKYKGKVLGKVTTTVARGASKRLTVTLTTAGKTFLKARKTVYSTIAITYPGGTNATSKTVTMALTLKASKL